MSSIRIEIALPKPKCKLKSFNLLLTKIFSRLLPYSWGFQTTLRSTVRMLFCGLVTVRFSTFCTCNWICNSKLVPLFDGNLHP